MNSSGKDDSSEEQVRRTEGRIWTISIATSVIGSAIFVAFLEPIMKGLGHAVGSLGGTLIQGLLDSIYKQAAASVSEQFLFQLLVPLYLIAANIAIVAFLISTGTVERIAKHVARDSENTKKLPRKSRPFRYFMSILSIFLLFQLAYLSMGNFIQMQAKVSFDTRLTALAPYISDAEYKMLAARWVLIDGRADYEALMGQMQSDADIHHVRLPPRLL